MLGPVEAVGADSKTGQHDFNMGVTNEQATILWTAGINQR